MCIFCKNRFSQDELFRMFFYDGSPILKYNTKLINVLLKINVDNCKEVFKKKSRSLYFCLNCAQKYLMDTLNIQYTVKTFKYHLSKFRGYKVELKELIFNLEEILKSFC
ncbi:MAG: hypothetical protein RMJ36_06020 [Candidatus Calescibacterium sp.]|nr:hypothetical protein [Candidatus Calescibacterium sp.]MDW8133193.1 hypothetical protein [Candidatus Calescibacterium sp.]